MSFTVDNQYTHYPPCDLSEAIAQVRGVISSAQGAGITKVDAFAR